MSTFLLLVRKNSQEKDKRSIVKLSCKTTVSGQSLDLCKLLFFFRLFHSLLASVTSDPNRLAFSREALSGLKIIKLLSRLRGSGCEASRLLQVLIFFNNCVCRIIIKTLACLAVITFMYNYIKNISCDRFILFYYIL